MTSRWFWLLRQLSRRIWVRASLFSLLAVGTALLGLWLSPYIPSDVPTKIGADSVDHILGIIASSMLTVTTFSLSTMVSAFSAATSNVTPRATRLVMEDSTTQTVLSTFVGSFLYSLVGIIVLSTGAYGAQGRVVLFAVTILVIVNIVVTLLRWMDHLARLGRVTETTRRVEDVALEAIRDRKRHPFLGGRPLHSSEDIPADARPIVPATVGYVQHIDVGALSAVVDDVSSEVYLAALPGDFVHPTAPVAFLRGTSDEQAYDRVRNCISIGDTRSFDQDPRFGASVLTEIASRALSSGINDLGTAIDVIGRAIRILSVWAEPPEAEAAIEYPKVHVPPIRTADLFDDLFTPISRDGASVAEIGIRLQKAFAVLACLDDGEFRDNSQRHSQEAFERAEAALGVELDKRRLRQLAQEVGSRAGPAPAGIGERIGINERSG